MFPIVNSPRCFLFGSTVLVLVFSAVRVDRYESNSLIGVNGYSKLVLSRDSFRRINPSVGEEFRYWSEEQEHSRKIIASRDRRELGHELILGGPTHSTSISWISYRAGTGSIWSEIFR